MKPKHTLSSFIFLFILMQSALGQMTGKEETSKQVRSFPLAFVEKHIMNSKVLEQNVDLNIYLPETYHETSLQHTYPVILLLENEFFYQITGVVKHLSSVNSMPEAIVISFPEVFEKFYAPKVYTNNSDFWPKSWKQMPFDGSPEVFSEFLKEELFTYLATHYRTANYRIIMGASPTATYPLHAFCKAPDLFQGHIAIAAGDILGMGYTPGENFVDIITESIKTNSESRRHLYVTSADSDVTHDSIIGKNLKDLEKQMSTITSQNFKLKAEVFPNESHYGVVLSGFISAMETFFPKKKWNIDFRDFEKQPGETMQNIDAYYQNLSSEYGYTVLPRADRWNSGSSLRASANRLLRQKRFKESIEVYQRLVTYCPKSAEALSSLASALEANKNYEEALSVQEKAIELAKQYDNNHLKYYKENMKKIASKISNVKE